MEPAESAGRRRIDIELSEHQERVLRVAVAQRIDVSDEAFRPFVDALDAPVEEMPTLGRYARKRSPIPAR